MSKMKFGQFAAAEIAHNAGATVTKIGHHYYNVEAVGRAAGLIDTVALTAQMEGRTLNAFESLMFEVLFDLAGWENRIEAAAAYVAYLKEEE